MEANILTKLKAALASREKTLRKTRFSVLIWGPGDDKRLTKKRADIVKLLKKHGFQAFTSEELEDQAPSSTNLPYQELEHWKAVNLVIVLEAGIAPAMEIASYAFSPGFCEKCVVFHPRDYNPVGKTTFPAGVLGLFPTRVIYSEQEMKDCNIIDECLIRAEAFRHCYALRNVPIKDLPAD